MSKEKQLLKNTIIVTIGKICTQLITFFLLPVYTAILTTEEYGTVDLLNTLISLVVPIITLQLEQGIFRFLIDYRNNEQEQEKIISTVLIFLMAQTIVYISLFSIVSGFINQQYKIFLATNVLAHAFSAILLQTSRGLGDNKTYAVGSFFTAASTVILNVVFIVYLKKGVYGMLTATLIGYLIGIIYIVTAKKIYKKVHLKMYNKDILRNMLGYSIPLIPNILSWWIVNVSDRTIVTSILGVGTNGILSVSNKFANVYTTLYSVFNMTWTESATLNINSTDRDEFFSKILNFILRFFGAIGLGIVAVMPITFGFLVNQSFKEAYYQIPILIIASMFNILVNYTGSIYVANKKTKEITKTSISAACINLVTNLSLIHFIGLYAASISTMVAYMVMFAYRFIDSKKYVNLKIDVQYILSLCILFSITTISYYINFGYLNVIMLLVVVVYDIYVNRNNITFIKDCLLKKFIKKEVKI